MNPRDKILRNVWCGRIPVCLRLSPEDLPADEPAPPPFFALIPRVTYFPLVIEKAVRICRFSWTRPVHLRAPDSGDRPTSVNYPNDILLAPPVNRASTKAIFMSTIKEADMLKHRGSVVSEMQPRDHQQLWTGLVNGTFEQFWAVNRRFMQPFMQSNPSPNPPPRPTLEDQEAVGETGDLQTSENVNTTSEDPPNLLVATGTRAFRYCPFRLYFSPLALEKSMQASEGVRFAEEALDPSRGDKSSGSYLPDNLPPYVQCPISPFNESGFPITFSDVLDSLFASPSLSRFSQLQRQDFAFFVHGVRVPDTTPGQWIAENLAYADNFVHIVARHL
nr:unnamed protein product [Spirometra erinaceieuropaei]